MYPQGVLEQLVSYTNVDWADDASDRRSTSEFMFFSQEHDFLVELQEAAMSASVKY